MYEIIWLLSTVTLAALLACCAKFLGKQILPALLAGALVTAIFVAGKLGDVPIWGSTALSASIVIYSMTFLLTDIMSELYGRRFTQSAVWGTALCYPVVFLSVQFSIYWEPSGFYADQEAFAKTAGTALIVTIASLCSFTASQTFDVWAFHTIRKKTRARWLWLRNNGSTMGSQAIDTVIFYTIANINWGMPAADLTKLIIVTYVLKLGIALVDTPFVYFVVNFVKSAKDYDGSAVEAELHKDGD